MAEEQSFIDSLLGGFSGDTQPAQQQSFPIESESSYDPFIGTGITQDGGKGLTAPEQVYTFPTAGTTVTAETASAPMIGEESKETGSTTGGLGVFGEVMKNPAMAAAIVNAVGSLMNKKKPKGLPTTAAAAYGNFTADQKKMIDHYLNKNSFDWKMNARKQPARFAEGGLARLAAGGTPPRPSAYQNKFNTAVDKWLNTQAGADRGRITKEQREATRSHLWDMANNTFGDIYGASLDEFGTGKWKGGEGFANPEVLANMQQYVKDPFNLIKSITPQTDTSDYSGAFVFDPTHNQWVQGGYQGRDVRNPRYNPRANDYGQRESEYLRVKDPRTYAWSDVDLEQNRQFGQNLNKSMFEAFYNPAQQFSTVSADPYAVDRYTQAMNPAYGELQKRLESLYGGKDALLKADAAMGGLYDDPTSFFEKAGMNLSASDLAAKYGEGLYGRSDKKLLDLYDDPMQTYLSNYAKTEPYQKYAKSQFEQYDPYTDMSFDDFASGLASGNLDVTQMMGKTPQQLSAERYEQQQNETLNKRLGTGYWSNTPGAYENVPMNLPTSNMGNVGAHRWFVDSAGESTAAPQGGLAVKNPPPPAPTPIAPAYDTNNITGYTTNAQGQQVPIYGQTQQVPQNYRDGGVVKLSGGGNPNMMPIPSGYKAVWFGDPSNPNSYFETTAIQPEQSAPKKKGCYVTSAVMQERGDADDEAPELQLMRQMRDEAYAESPEEYGPKIEEYYRTAPKVVEALEGSPEGRIILKEVYAKYIRPAAEAMANGDRQTAEELYHEMLEFVAPYAAGLMEDDGAAAEAIAMGAHASGDGQLGRVDGHGNGQDDKIPALLSKDEYVFDADTVAALGDGSSEAGAKMLDEMRERIRTHKRSAPAHEIPPAAKSPLEYLKKGA